MNILQQAQEVVHNDRHADYGPVEDSFGTIAKGWSIILGQEISAYHVGLCMAWLKLARELHKPKRDNMVDLAGYAECISRLQ
jgi:hypothetical protein